MAGIVWDEASKKSNGGTELLGRELERRLPFNLLNHFQIFLSRVNVPLADNKIRILWAHNLANDIQNVHLLKDGWSRFHKIVFVSDHQMQEYIRRYNIPWSKCLVLQNAIVPIPAHKKPSSRVRLIYTPTPHRGLSILYPVFDKLSKEYDDIELSVFSSFNLYGWTNDAPYEKLFEALRKHPKITYHGAVDNSIIREHLEQSHIFAYPSIWQETSCLCLIEAMSAGLLCVHPRYGALTETAANWNLLYQWHEDPKQHANIFYNHLRSAILLMKENQAFTQAKIQDQIAYVDNFYNWNTRAIEWEHFLRTLLQQEKCSLPDK